MPSGSATRAGSRIPFMAEPQRHRVVNFHLFQPLLYRVATGAPSPGRIASPPRGVLKRHMTRVSDGEGGLIPPPGVAPAAMHMGRDAAKVVRGRLAGTAAPTPFHYPTGLQNRMIAFIRWTVGFLTRGRGAPLITGEAPGE